MKNKLSKKINNKNIKIFIPIIMLIVLLIIVFIYLKEYQYNRYRNQKDEKFYQYFAGQKIEYDATVSYPNVNFIFKNSNDYSVYIKAECENGNLKIEIYKMI